MDKTFIYVCSPLRGDMEENIKKARRYCRKIVEHCPNAVPIAPHIYFTQFLDDMKPTERNIGMSLGLALLDKCDELWVFGIEKPSEGMRREIDYATKRGIRVVDGLKEVERWRS